MELLETVDSTSIGGGSETITFPFNAKAVFDSIADVDVTAESRYDARNDRLKELRKDDRFRVYWTTIDSMLQLPFAEYMRKKAIFDAIREQTDDAFWEDFERRHNERRKIDLEFERARVR